MSKRHAPDTFEQRLDELLWQVAAEHDLETERAEPAEIGDERVRADVRRWMATRSGADAERRTHGSASSWLRAAAVVLAVGGIGAAGYWAGWLEPRPRIPQAEGRAALTRSGDEESWYVQVSRAPDRAESCTSDSWYCVEASRDL